MSHVLAFIRWKKLPRRKSKGQGGGEGKGGKGKGRNGGATPGVSPTPGGGLGRKAPALLPKQRPEFAGRKQVGMGGRISSVILLSLSDIALNNKVKIFSSVVRSREIWNMNTCVEHNGTWGHACFVLEKLSDACPGVNTMCAQ